MIIDSKIWNDQWFTSLNQRLKLLYLYILSSSSKCGIFELNARKINFDLTNGEEEVDRYTIDEILSFAGDRIVRVNESKAIVADYIAFNWAKTKNFNQNNPLFKSIKNELASVGLTLQDVNRMSKRKFMDECVEQDEFPIEDEAPSDDEVMSDNAPSKETIKKDAEELFEGFWNAYKACGCKRMQEKPKCKAKYIKYLLESKDHVKMSNDIYNGLMLWAKSDDWKKNDGMYIMMPSRWLNNRNWETPPEKGSNNENRYRQRSANSDYQEGIASAEF